VTQRNVKIHLASVPHLGLYEDLTRASLFRDTARRKKS